MRGEDIQGCVERTMREAVRLSRPLGASDDVLWRLMAGAAITTIDAHNARVGLAQVWEHYLWLTKTHVARAVEDPAIMTRDESLWLMQLKWQVHMLSPEPTKIMVYPAESMPSFLDHGKGSGAHSQGLNGNLPHNVVNHSHAERLRAILGG